MVNAERYWLQVWSDLYQDGEILDDVFRPKTYRELPDLSVDGPRPESVPEPSELHAIHAAYRSVRGWSVPAGAVSYTLAELEAAGGTLVYAPEPHNPYHYNVEFRGLAGLSGGALRRGRREVKERLKRTVFDWTPQ